VQDCFYEIGDGSEIQPGALVGLKYKPDAAPARIGARATIRAGAIIYGDVVIGDDFQTGHQVLLRENTKIGRHVLLGTQSVIDGQVTIGDFVKIETNVYIPTHVTMGSFVFIGPGVTITNDRFPLRQRDTYKPERCVIEDGVTIGGGVTIVPGITIGEDSFIAAGAIVTKDIPPRSLVIGAPGVVKPLPPHLNERNMAKGWKRILDAEAAAK
jgi:acetyltransferase-like isoleucine patch superfamily enzyme